jgi:hypothetical protein
VELALQADRDATAGIRTPAAGDPETPMASPGRPAWVHVVPIEQVWPGSDTTTSDDTPCVGRVIIGDILGSLEAGLAAEHVARLDEVSRIDLARPRSRPG